MKTKVKGKVILKVSDVCHSGFGLRGAASACLDTECTWEGARKAGYKEIITIITDSNLVYGSLHSILLN